jgi:hypothetical protein
MPAGQVLWALGVTGLLECMGHKGEGKHCGAIQDSKHAPCKQGALESRGLR